MKSGPTLHGEIDADLLISADRLAQIGRFVPSFAHELNNCFQAIAGLAELALDDPSVTPAVADRLHRMLAQSQRGSLAIGHLLGFARERSAAIAEVDLAALAGGVVSLHQHTLKRLRAEVTIDRESGASFETFGSARELEQMLLALVSNAEEALKAVNGSRQLRLSLEADDGAVSVHVSDTGEGPPDKIGQSLCDPFVTGWDPAEHAGLGLAAARAIAERHGGSIAFERNAEAGTTTVTVRLPKRSRRTAAASRREPN